jgi:DNA-binding NtrC family response regulator
MIRHTTATWPRDVPPIRVVNTRDTLRRVERHALLAARDYANVLLTGRHGADKAGVARFIHENSDRATRGFASIECDGLPDFLIESALFGHVQGSFAGAYRDKPGLVESVPGGTIFLDDVDALSARTQARLLRFLETGEYLRIGGQPVRIQPWLAVRVIASTTVDLAARVAAGLFLNDLYIRLSVHRLPVPAPPAGTPAWRYQ